MARVKCFNKKRERVEPEELTVPIEKMKVLFKGVLKNDTRN